MLQPPSLPQSGPDQDSPHKPASVVGIVGATDQSVVVPPVVVAVPPVEYVHMLVSLSYVEPAVQHIPSWQVNEVMQQPPGGQTRRNRRLWDGLATAPSPLRARWVAEWLLQRA